MVEEGNRRDLGLRRGLRDTSAADLLRGLGAKRSTPLLAGLARLAVSRFVTDVSEMDAAVARGGLAAAAEVVLPRYAGEVTIRGGQPPAEGPLLVVSNHAGTVDAPAIWRMLAVRDDVLIIALERPILRTIPHMASRLLYVNGDAHGRTGLVRRAAEHLRSGGAILTFPAGTIEPDPRLRFADALASLDSWGSSVELLVRLAPGTAVLPVAVSGVISQRMLRNPLARRRATAEDSELAAATLQILVRDRSVRPVVSVGEPLRGRFGVAELREAMVQLLHDCVSGPS